MLALLMTLGGHRYGIGADDIVEVIPYVPLQKVRSEKAWLVGNLDYHGKPVPAVDLAMFLGARQSSSTLSTRIVLIRNGTCDASTLIGLVADEVTEVARIDDKQLLNAIPTSKDKSYDDEVTLSPQGDVLRVLRLPRLFRDLAPALKLAGPSV